MGEVLSAQLLPGKHLVDMFPSSTYSILVEPRRLSAQQRNHYSVAFTFVVPLLTMDATSKGVEGIIRENAWGTI